MHGTTYANYAANEADLVIAAGMRLMIELQEILKNFYLMQKLFI